MSRFASLVASATAAPVTPKLVKRLGLAGTDERVFRDAGRIEPVRAVPDPIDRLIHDLRGETE